MIEITEHLGIPENEIKFSTVRSSGPGGQHVNTADTKVILRFNVEKSRALSGLQKVFVKGKLRRRINKEGWLVLSCERERSQEANKRGVIKKFQELMREALKVEQSRFKTKVPKSSRRKRADNKKLRGALKRMRQRPKMSD